MVKGLKTQTSSVKLKNLVKKFPSDKSSEDNIAVNNLDLNVESGELVTLLGPSGCGKTTTLRMIAGFEFPTSGSVFIGDEDISSVSPNKRDIGMVFQSYALFPHLTVYDNIAYGLKIKKLSQEEIKMKVKAVLEIMQLHALADRSPSQLSGGQQQRVALARAVVTEPKVLLFDEPLSNLDAKLREYMREELRNIQKRLGITSLYVTHDQTEAMAISDKVVIMNDGELQQVDTPYNIYISPANHFVADFMGKANFVSSVIKDINQSEIEIELLGRNITINNHGNKQFKPVEQVDCVIRPEFWKIDPNGEFNGVVEKVIYFGNNVEYTIKINEEELIFTDTDHVANGVRSVGENINLHLEKGNLSLLK